MTNPAATLSTSPDLSLKERLDASGQLCTQAGQGSPQPLSLEARRLNSNFSMRRDLVDVVEKAIESTKGNELKKLTIYEIALKVCTVIGAAILFAIPLCMLLGVPLWIPVVICIGAGITFSIVKGCLRRRCQQIRQEYRALHLYHRYLLSNKDSIDGTFLSRFDVRVRKPEEKLHGVDSEKRGDNHPIAADRKYDFAGLAHQRYQVDAAIGIPSVQNSFWRSAAQQVKVVKDEIISGEKTSEDLRLISKQALQVAGIDFSGAAGKESVLDVAKSLASLLAFGAQVGKDAQKSTQQYHQRFFGSPLLATWCGADLSLAAQDFVAQGKNFLDVSSRHYATLQIAIEKVQLVPVLCKIRGWKDRIRSLAQQKTLTAALLRKLYCEIEDAMHEICIEDGISPYIQDQVRIVTQKCLREELKDLLGKTDEELKPCDLSKIQRSVCLFATSVVSLLEGRMGVSEKSSIKEIEETVYRELGSTILQLGGLSGGITPLIDNVHKAIRQGRALSNELRQSIQLHPERRFHRLQAKVEKLQGFIRDPKWGASAVHLSSQETLEQKRQLLDKLTGIQTLLSDWETRYSVFKETKLTHIVMEDFFKETEKFLNSHSAVAESCSLDCSVEELKDCDQALNADLGNIEKVMNPADVESAEREFKQLISDLAGVQEQLDQLSVPICEEGVSGKRLLLNTLLSHPDTLQKKELEKRAALEAFTSGEDPEFPVRKEETLDMVSSGYDYLSNLLGKINSFESILEESRDKKISSQYMQQLMGLANEISYELSSSRKDPIDNLLCRLEGLSTSIPLEESVEVSSSPVAEKIARASYQRINRVEKSKVSKTLKAFTHLIKELRRSLRKAMLSKAVVAAVLSIAFSCLAIALFSVQLTWLPIAFCVIALVLEAIPAALSIWVDKENWKVEVASLAKELSSDKRKLPYPEMDVQNIRKLKGLKDSYGLDGVSELRVAEAALLGAKKLPEEQKQDTLQSTIKALRADLKVLNKKFKRLPESYQPKKSSEAVSAKRSNGNAASVEKELAALEEKQKECHAACLQFETESSRFLAERNRAKLFESKIAQQRKEREELGNQEARYTQVISCLEAFIARKGVSAQHKSKEDLSLKITELLSLNNQSLKKRDCNPLSRMQGRFQAFAEEGCLQDVKGLLELNMCLGSAEFSLYRDEQNRMSSERFPFQNSQQLLQYGKNLFDSYDKGDRTPLLQFILGSGWGAIREACFELKSLNKRKQKGSSFAPEDYENACKALKRFLKARESLRFKLSLPLGGNSELEIGLQHHIRNQQWTKDRLTGRHQECCRDILQHLEDWITKTRNESQECQKVETEIQNFCQKEGSCKNLQDSVKILFSNLQADLNKIPQDILRAVLRSLSLKLCYIMDKKLECEKLEEKFAKVDAVVKIKESEFEEHGEKWFDQYQLLQTQMKQLELQKEKLLAEKN
ncbi:hypothetical protein C6H88_02170 [Chlamydia muridarum str. Nigg]|uniref:Membrane protein n=2 Tax=Chlamydia muridarum TaxID=83560 RepID=A0A070A005_CHLMR|nr:hypothetical protein [Chlamydia muridarum]UFT29174.1 DUF2721 domain-containing protein [Chlamydia trachomatis]AAF39280.1 conserved hypothetical protein [Chlamydia muridarum str. Nigg]AHH22808.1 membrane protein [Chlamydia muridarum str. Nigg3 CMUT3-5]AHH23733.1 membrane protein [Chlamydia muridarum str. Nigg CM972]AID37947.1 membrane protein [Chlamydia muridarum str. Nigg 2 MCR]